MAAKRDVVVSYHPIIEGDVNLLFADRLLNEEDFYWMKRARAVVLPQGCRPELYFAAINHCPNVFPDYRARFLYPGKTGQIRLFRHLGIPHPRSHLFGSVAGCPDWFRRHLKYPVVVKSAWGGEGSNVYLVKSRDELSWVMDEIGRMEKAGWPGFVVQDYIDAGGRDLRVVVIGDERFCYWRVGDPDSDFRYNVARGGRVEYPVDREEVLSALRLVDYVVKKTGINLAGFDIIFSRDDTAGKHPFMVEINYFFGRTGLGGNQRYYKILKEVVDRWLNSVF